MTPKERIAELRKVVDKATPGPWLEREDHDYYQGGTYLGVGPYFYQGPPNNRKIPGISPSGIFDYFEKNVCRIESDEEDKRFIAASRTMVPALLDALEKAVDGLENISGQSKLFINADELRALNLCEDLARATLSQIEKTLGGME